MEARDLIDRSVSHTEIVSTAWSQALEDELQSACEGSVEAEGVIEYWGTRADGEEWRVHLALDADAEAAYEAALEGIERQA